MFYVWHLLVEWTKKVLSKGQKTVEETPFLSAKSNSVLSKLTENNVIAYDAKDKIKQGFVLLVFYDQLEQYLIYICIIKFI